MPASLVGRDKERQQLEAWLVAAADGVASTVLLSGDAGVGKSRLLESFTGTAAARGAYVLSGSCIELGDGVVPYAPLVEALRLLVRERGMEYAEALAGPAWAELSGLISHFTGAEPVAGAVGSQLRVFGAVLRLLDHIGARAPVVLVFEDIHWADPSTVDLVAYLTRVKSNQRMMLVCSHRSGLEEDNALRALLAEPDFLRRIHRVALTGLTKPELREFLTASAGRPVGRDRVDRYFELSDGNPFFAEMLLHAEDGTDRPADGVPETLSDIMLARLRQLSGDATEVLRVAAVAGRRVSDRVLATVSELDGRRLDAALRECLDRQMLVARADGESYAFRHALLRAAVYQYRLLGRERRRMHAAMAEALTADADGDPTVTPELAYHWFAADRKAEALATAVRAGGTTARVYAFQEARTQYRRALELWSQVPEPETVGGAPRERVLGAAADAARWAGDVTQAVEWVRAAIAEVDPESDPRRAGELYERLGSYQWEAGAIDESVAAYEQARLWLEGQPPTAVAARVLAALATAAVRAGRHGDGLERAQRAIELARQVGATAEEGRALNSAGLALTMLGKTDEGTALLRQALDIATAVDHLEDRFRAYGNLGLALEHAGELAGAVEVLQEGLAQARALGLFDARQGGVLANNASAALFLLGRWDEAVTLLDEVLLDRPVKQSVYLRLTRAEIDVAQGRFADAERLLAEVRGQPNTDPRFVGPLCGCTAELASWRGDTAGAASAAAHGIETVDGSADALVLLRLCAVGLRAVADSGSPSGDTDGPDTDGPDTDLLGALARRVAGDGMRPPEVDALAGQCEAERARAGGTDSPDMWAGVATAWDNLQRPYPVAYARFREAEAALRAGDRPRGVQAARAAHAMAQGLSAVPLRDRVAALAGRRRIDLTPRAVRPYDQYRLTEAEVKVLREACAGHTNRVIGRRLHISESTVSVHLSHIYGKLGVHGRTEAAALAHRNGFFAEEVRSSA